MYEAESSPHNWRACAKTAVVYPEFELLAHMRLLVEKLEAVERGKIRRLMLFLPPRLAKTQTASALFPARHLGRHRNRSIITSAYSQDFVDDVGRNVWNLVSEALHRAIFPNFGISEDSTSMRRFNSTAGSSYYAVGRGCPITGRGADLLIIVWPLSSFALMKLFWTRGITCRLETVH